MKPGMLIDLQKRKYKETYSFQKKIHELRVKGMIPDTLLAVEHPPVYTVGRAGGFQYFKMPKEYLVEKGVEIHEIDRGGSVTFHGPGQLVCYFIFDLNSLEKDLHLFLRSLEEVILRALKDLGLEARRFPPHTGVWVGQEKIAAIGVGCKKWVTFHGFALNVNTDLHYFDLIEPCGIKEYGVTSFAKIYQKDIAMVKVKEKIISKFEEVFEISLRPKLPGTIINILERCLTDETSLLVKSESSKPRKMGLC